MDSKTIRAWLKVLKDYRSSYGILGLRLYSLNKRFNAFVSDPVERNQMEKVYDLLQRQIDLFIELVKELPAKQQRIAVTNKRLEQKPFDKYEAAAGERQIIKLLKQYDRQGNAIIKLKAENKPILEILET